MLVAALLVAGATAATAVAGQTVLETRDAADKMLSEESWRSVVQALGGSFGYAGAEVSVPYSPLAAVLFGASGAAWLAGGWLIAWRSGRPVTEALATWGRFGWLWWFVPGACEAARLAAFATGLEGLSEFLVAAPNFLFAFVLAGWMATFFALFRPAHSQARAGRDESSRLPLALWLAMAAYFIVFGTMNVLLWQGLRVPHGDSAMFEEHLWNLTHGRGFRSYIDGHVFLGEHFQVAHLLLLPAYLVWPSHLLLELCQSATLAAGAAPVFRMTLRQTGSERSALLLACAYLLYFPMQMLDLDIVGKTFRVEAFGILFLLLALNELDRGRLARTAALLLLALTAREDFGIVFAPLGLWIGADAWRRRRESGNIAHAGPKTAAGAAAELPSAGVSSSRRDRAEAADWRRRMAFGASLAVLSAAYVLFVVKVGIPYFRGGQPHYVAYFGRLGGSVDDLLRTALTDPGSLARGLATYKTLLYAISLQLSVGFLPLLSPGRLAVALPLFATVCLNELSEGPYHHFHAPLIPVVFWAAAAGLGRAPAAAALLRRLTRSAPTNDGALPRWWAAHFGWTGAFALGVFFSYGPLGVLFWDPGTPFHWRKRFVPGPRAEAFPKLFAKVPADARVAATDFVHPRFTHHDRPYDYGRFPRAVNDGRPGAPPDSDYIVIDVIGNDLGIERPKQIPEFRDHPEQWDVLPDETGGLFLVLRRRWSDAEREAVRKARAGAEDGRPTGRL